MFVETINGNFINLAHIVRAEEYMHQSKDTGLRQPCYRLIDANGEPIGSTLTYPKDAAAPVVPALPGFNVLAYRYWESGDCVDASPVLAWRILDLHSVPILIEDSPGEHDSNSEWVIERPDGRVIRPYDAEFEDRAAWLQHERAVVAGKRAAAAKAAA